MTTFVVNAAGQTLAGNTSAADAPMSAYGKITLDGTSITATSYLAIDVGFTPKYFRLENATDSISVEWFEGMAEDTCIKTAAAGTRTLETTNKGVSLASKSSTTAASTDAAARTVLVSQNATLAVVAASKVLYWVARS